MGGRRGKRKKVKRIRKKKEMVKTPSTPGGIDEFEVLKKRARKYGTVAVLAVLVGYFFQFLPKDIKEIKEHLSLWNLPVDEKKSAFFGKYGERRVGFGKDEYEFTLYWRWLLPEDVLPLTKFRDFTRRAFIEYLLPGERRKYTPSVMACYGLTPEHISIVPIRVQTEFEKEIDFGSVDSVGQSFVTVRDFDVINSIIALAKGVDPNMVGLLEMQVWNKPTKDKLLGRASKINFRQLKDFEELSFIFERPVRLGYGRGATRYYFEIKSKEKLPIFFLHSTKDPDRQGEMIVDGVKRGSDDLAFVVQGTYTDLSDYEPLDIYKPGYFIAIKRDLFEKIDQQNKTKEEVFRDLGDLLRQL